MEGDPIGSSFRRLPIRKGSLNRSVFTPIVLTNRRAVRSDLHQYLWYIQVLLYLFFITGQRSVTPSHHYISANNLHKSPLAFKLNSNMAPSKPLDAEASLAYLLLLISKSEFMPDFHATAAAADMANANNAQKKFKKIVEQDGKYKLVKGKITAVEEEEDDEDEN